MSSLTLSRVPGFSEIPDASFNAGNPATDTDLKAVNAGLQFAAVRGEQFWGFYKHGETVALPVSPADGYAYIRAELLYVFQVYWTGAAPGGALNGTQTAPARGATGGGGTLLQMGFDVDNATGVVACNVSYFDGHEHDVNDGILKVTTIALRSR